MVQNVEEWEGEKEREINTKTKEFLDFSRTASKHNTYFFVYFWVIFDEVYSTHIYNLYIKRENDNEKKYHLKFKGPNNINRKKYKWLKSFVVIRIEVNQNHSSSSSSNTHKHLSYVEDWSVMWIC